MELMALALGRSLVSLGRGRVWRYLLVPTLLALILMGALSWFLLDQLVALLLDQPPMSWLSSWGAFWLAHLLASLGGWLGILSLTYLFAVVLTGIVVMPLLLNHLAAADYPDVVRAGSDSVIASTWNSVAAAGLFLLGWGLTLPLWLVPGLGLMMPLFWMAWLNRRTFAYDALSNHATAQEWRALRDQHSGRLLLLGVLMALLTHLPWIGLLAPALAALAYIHYCLEALRRLRCGALMSTESIRERS